MALVGLKPPLVLLHTHLHGIVELQGELAQLVDLSREEDFARLEVVEHDDAEDVHGQHDGARNENGVRALQDDVARGVDERF